MEQLFVHQAKGIIDIKYLSHTRNQQKKTKFVTSTQKGRSWQVCFSNFYGKCR